MSLLPFTKKRRNMTTERSNQIVGLARDGGDRWFNDDASYVLWTRGLLQSAEDRKRKA